jgi:branched-chain amino acid transport system permease protein
MTMTRTGTDATRLLTPAMLAVLVGLASLPQWIGLVGFYPYLGIEIVIWAIYALSFNLLLGYTGLPSFGHGAYFGIGAYAFGLFQQNMMPDLWPCLLAAMGAAAAAGTLVAAFISHRRGIYYAFMTIAFGQVFWVIAIKSHSITGGEDGLLRILRAPADFGIVAFDLRDNVSLYYFVLGVFAVVLVGLWRLVNSPYGRILQAVKQNETRAAFIGYNVWLYKFSVFAISAGLSGLAGGLFAMAQTSAFPDVMSLHYSGYVVMMTLIGGGMVSFWGPVIGAALFLLTRDAIGAVTTAWMLWFGLLFMLVVLFKPEGIAGWWQDFRRADGGRWRGFARLRMLFGS